MCSNSYLILKQEGQGLGKQEQGISMALQVEKTSKRGGRIISEKEIMPPPSVTSPGSSSPTSSPQQQGNSAQLKPEPTITEIMRSPSKVVLLRVSHKKHNFLTNLAV
jgi:splicing factor 45